MYAPSIFVRRITGFGAGPWFDNVPTSVKQSHLNLLTNASVLSRDLGGEAKMQSVSDTALILLVLFKTRSIVIAMAVRGG